MEIQNDIARAMQFFFFFFLFLFLWLNIWYIATTSMILQVASDECVDTQSKTFDRLVSLVSILSAYAFAEVQCKVKRLVIDSFPVNY